MGNYLTAPLKTILKKYTINFEEKQVSLNLMKSQFKIENLILNVEQINKELNAKKLPFKLKFGVLKKFRLKLSIFGGKLENLDIDSLILILGSNSQPSEKFRGIEEEKIYLNCLKNMELEKKGKKNLKLFNPDLIFSKENEEYQNLKKEKVIVEKKKKKQKKEGINLMGIEVFEIVKNFLGCKINIANIHLIYEDKMSFTKSSAKMENFILTAQFKEFSFKVDDIKKFTNKQGYFKNFFNIATFLKKSGTWNASDMAYWNIGLESFKVSFSIGNDLFIVNNNDISVLRQDRMDLIIHKFHDNLKKNRFENSFDLLSLNKISGDFIIFYKESSKVPIHGVFVNFEFLNLDLNLEINKFEIILELMSYFNNYGMAKKFDMIKPKFKVLTNNEYNKLCLKLKLNLEQKKNLKRLNRWVIKEYLMVIIYLNRYGKLLSEKIKPEHAKILILKDFVKESLLYKIIFGDKYPKYFNDYTHEQLIGESDREPVEKKKKKEKTADEILNDPTTKLLNKIHIHFRIQINLKVNILSSRNHLPENVLQIKDLTLDVFNPVANLKVKILLTLSKLILTADKEQYPTTKKGKMGIFGNNRGNRTNYSSIMNFDDSNSILCFSNLQANVDVTLKAGKDGKFVYIVYSDNVIGAFNYNYFPNIFRKLVTKFIKLKKVQDQNSRTKFVKGKSKNISKLGGKKNFKRKDNVSNALKGQMFEKKLKHMEEKDFRRQNLKINKYSRTAKKHYGSEMKKSNIKFNFDKNAKTKLEKYKELKDKVDKLEEKNFQSQIGKSKPKKKEEEKMLEKLNKLLQNVVISLRIKSEPICIKVFDEDHKENLAFKYENQDIVIEIDLAFKEITSIKAFGMEIQSRESLYALKKLTESIQSNMDQIKSFHETVLLEDLDESF